MHEDQNGEKPSNTLGRQCLYLVDAVLHVHRSFDAGRSDLSVVTLKQVCKLLS